MTSQHEDTESVFGDESSWDAFDFGPQMLDGSPTPPTAPPVAPPVAAPANPVFQTPPPGGPQVAAPAAPGVPSSPPSGARPSVARPRPVGMPAPQRTAAHAPMPTTEAPAAPPAAPAAFQAPPTAFQIAPAPAYTPVSATPPPAPLRPQPPVATTPPVQATVPAPTQPVTATPFAAPAISAAPATPAAPQVATEPQAEPASAAPQPLPAWASGSLDDFEEDDLDNDGIEALPVDYAHQVKPAPTAPVTAPALPTPHQDDEFEDEDGAVRGRRSRKNRAPNTRAAKASGAGSKGRGAKKPVTAKSKKQVDYAGPGTGTKVARGLWYAVLGVLLLGGLKNVVTSEAPVDTKAIAADAATLMGATQFPIDAAEAFATRFAGEYLTYNQRGYDKRLIRLTAYAPAIVDAGWGWDGAGKQTVINGPFVGSETVASDDNNALVTVIAQVDSGAWVSLAVPVYAAESGALVVSGAPAFVALPALAVNPDPEEEITSSDMDDELATVLAEQVLPGFFQAWAESDQTELDRYTTLDASVAARTGLAGALLYRGIDEVSVPVGDTQREATVSVEWDAGRAGSYLQAYKVTVSQGPDGRWSVADIAAGVLVEGEDPDLETGGPLMLPEDTDSTLGETVE